MIAASLLLNPPPPPPPPARFSALHLVPNPAYRCDAVLVSAFARFILTSRSSR